MTRHFVDLSITLDNDVVKDRLFLRPENLEEILGSGFTFACISHKIKGASSGGARAVAIIED